MSYQGLARKYRTQRSSDVIGQPHVTRTLQNAIEQQRIAHGYIFSGHRGIGKTTIARVLAMALNCRSADHPVAEPCGVCESCTEIRDGSSVDVMEIDAATNRCIDEIRELRDALSIMDQAIACCGERLTGETVLQLVGSVPSQTLEDMMGAVARNCSEDVMRMIDRLITEGQSPAHFARQLVRFLRNAVIARV